MIDFLLHNIVAPLCFRKFSFIFNFHVEYRRNVHRLKSQNSVTVNQFAITKYTEIKHSSCHSESQWPLYFCKVTKTLAYRTYFLMFFYFWIIIHEIMWYTFLHLVFFPLKCLFILKYTMFLSLFVLISLLVMYIYGMNISECIHPFYCWLKLNGLQFLTIR